jgi:hypothetical protein
LKRLMAFGRSQSVSVVGGFPSPSPLAVETVRREGAGL